MKIFTILLGYLVVACFDYTVFASPAGVADGRKGDIMQQHNDVFISRQVLETRQGDPALFPLAVSLIVSAIGLSVQGKTGSTDDLTLREEFTTRTASECSATWTMWNWVVVTSNSYYLTYNIYALKRGWYEYQLVLDGPYNYTVLWFQDAQLNLMQNLGSGGWAYLDTGYQYNTVVTATGETDVDFHAPDPGITIEKGINDDVDRMVEEISSAVANLDGDKWEKRAKFTRWVADNGSQQWSEFNWVVESNPHYIRPDGIIGTDWGVSLYELFFQSPSVEFYVYWLKSGKVINEGEDGDEYWAWKGCASAADQTSLPPQFLTKGKNTILFCTPYS